MIEREGEAHVRISHLREPSVRGIVMLICLDFDK